MPSPPRENCDRANGRADDAAAPGRVRACLNAGGVRWALPVLALAAAVLGTPGTVRADSSEPVLPEVLQDERYWSHPIGTSGAGAAAERGSGQASQPRRDPARAPSSAPSRQADRPAGELATRVATNPRARDSALAECLRAHDWSATPWTTCGTGPIPLTDRAKVPDLLLGRPSALVDAWNGAALGPRRMYFHGGGHHDYGGNEVIGFNYHDLEWDFRIPLNLVPQGRSVASYPPDAFARDVYPSGAPGATHTYDGIVYAPATGEVFRFGGVGYWPRSSAVQNMSNEGVFVFDPDAERPAWQHVGTVPADLAANGPSVKSRLDPRTGHILVRGRHGEASFDPTTRAWGPVSTWSAFESQGSIGSDPTGTAVWYADNKQMWVKQDGRKAVAADPYGGGEPFCDKQGMDWHPGHRVLAVWCGGAEVRTWDPASQRWESYRPEGEDAAAPTAGQSKGVFSKWAYLPDYDVFIGYNNTEQGVWFFRLPARSSPDPRRERLAAQGFECADGVLDWPCPDLQDALAGAGAPPTGVYRSGALIDRAGSYDFAGSRLTRAIRGKAAVIVRAEQVTLRNLACQGISVPSGNGACVRQQSAALTIEGARMSGGQSFLLGNPGMRSLVVSGLEIAEVGGDCSQKCGRAHGIYYNANQGELTVRRSQLRRARDAAHLIKSGAAVTRIEDTVLDERDGAGSRAIDAYNGGHLILRNVTIHARADDGNREIIGWDYGERSEHPRNRITFDNVTIHCDYGSRLLGYRRGNAPTLENAESIAWPDGQCM
jgi:hypothetical protein